MAHLNTGKVVVIVCFGTLSKFLELRSLVALIQVMEKLDDGEAMDRGNTVKGFHRNVCPTCFNAPVLYPWNAVLCGKLFVTAIASFLT
jgi:hypothetical protein